MQPLSEIATHNKIQAMGYSSNMFTLSISAMTLYLFYLKHKHLIIEENLQEKKNKN